MRRNADFRQGCDDLAESATTARFTRRSLLRAAVFTPREATYHSLWDPRQAAARTAITGQVVDVSPHIIVLNTAHGERRLALSPQTTAWRGTAVPPAVLRQGDQAIVRHHDTRGVAERIWTQIGRVTGTIIETDGSALLVDEGPAKGRKIVLIDKGAERQIQVRFPRLEPGYLIDVIGLRHQGYLQAMTHATSQPPYRQATPRRHP